MKIDIAFLKEHRACKPGIDWFCEHVPSGETEHEELIEKLLAGKRASDANWLLCELFTRKQALQYVIVSLGFLPAAKLADPIIAECLAAIKACLEDDSDANRERARKAADAAFRAAYTAAAFRAAADADTAAFRAARVAAADAYASAADTADAAASSAADTAATLEAVVRKGMEILREE